MPSLVSLSKISSKLFFFALIIIHILQGSHTYLNTIVLCRLLTAHEFCDFVQFCSFPVHFINVKVPRFLQFRDESSPKTGLFCAEKGPKSSLRNGPNFVDHFMMNKVQNCDHLLMNKV